jgi:hypothetical protein
MSDAVRLFKVVLQMVNRLMPDMLYDNRVTLAYMITGILKGKNVQFRKIAQAVRYPYQKTSLEDRFRRFVRNHNIVVDVQFIPLVELILSALSQEVLVLLIDSTKVGGGCICLMIGVMYKSRALPLGWVVFKGRKGHSSQETQLALFETVKSMLPDNCQVIALGDGEFDGSQVIDWFETETNWQYTCRTANDTLIWYEGEWTALRDLPFLESGQGAFLTGVLFTQSGQVGPGNILVVWNQTEGCHWFFVTNFDTQAEAQKWYRKRFTIETLFSDVKGRGFHLDKTRLWKPERVSRLIFATAMAYIFSVFLGVESIVSRAFIQLVRTDAFYHSLFQLGLIYLDHLLNECLPIPPLIRLHPPSSFDHIVIA